MNKKIQSYKAGTLLMTEGSKSRKMLIIHEGKVRIFRTYLNQKITLAVLGKGEVFGEMSFFDAEPRSASAEALTPVDAIVLENEDLDSNALNIPSWVTAILKMSFQRFREADRKIIILQSMYEYGKRTLRTDVVSKTIYLELMRFIKTSLLLYHEKSVQGEIQEQDFINELGNLLGDSKLSLSVFWKMLKEHDMVDLVKMESGGTVILNEAALEDWNVYLRTEAASDRYLLLSHTAVAILGKIVGRVLTNDSGTINNPQHWVRFELSDARLRELSFHEDGIKELKKLGLLKGEETLLEAQPMLVHQHFLYQTILKAFDHTSMTVD